MPSVLLFLDLNRIGMIGKGCDEFSGKIILINFESSSTRKSQTRWLWMRPLPSWRISTSDMDFEADFDVPKNGILVVEAMIISRR